MEKQLITLIAFWLFITIGIGYAYIKGGKPGVSYIKRYVRADDKWTTEIVEGTYSDINYKDYTWKLIPEVSTQGWVQDKIPPDPPIAYIIASEGMLEIAEQKLKESILTIKFISLNMN